MEFIIWTIALCVCAISLCAYFKGKKEHERREREFKEFCQRLCTNKDERYNFEILPNGDFKIITRNIESEGENE